MSEDMKILLSKFDELKADITELKTDVNGQIADLRTEVVDLRTEVADMRTEVAGIKTDVTNLKAEVADFKLDVYGQIHELREELGDLKEETKKTRLILEQDISRKIDVIGEGHDFLKRRLEEAMRFEKDRERMDLELISLRMDVRKLQERVEQIA